MRRIWLALLTGVVLSAGAAFAASLGVGVQFAASGSAPLTPCGSVTDFELLPVVGDPSVVDTAKLTTDESCNGGKTFVALIGNGNVLSVGGPATISGGAVTVDTEPNVEASQIIQLQVTIIGP